MDKRELMYFTENDVDPKLIVKQLNYDLKKYGVSFPAYDPDTIAVFVKREFNRPLHEAVLNKLKAYYHLLKTRSVYEHWQVFEPIANALIDGVFSYGYFQPPALHELLLTCYIAQRDAKRMLKYITDEVKTYVTTLWQKQHGLRWPIEEILPFWNGDSMPKAVAEYIEFFLTHPEAEPVWEDPYHVQAYRLAALKRFVNRFENTGAVTSELVKTAQYDPLETLLRRHVKKYTSPLAKFIKALPQSSSPTTVSQSYAGYSFSTQVNRTLHDFIRVSDSVHWFFESLGLTETINVADVVGVSSSELLTIEDAIRTTDLFEAAAGVGAVDVISAGDGVGFEREFFYSDAIEITDDVGFGGSTSVEEAMRITDALEIGTEVSQVDEIAIDGVVSFEKEYIIGDAIRITDESAVGSGLEISESITVYDGFVPPLRLADTVYVTDQFLTGQQFLETETLVLSDGLLIDIHYATQDAVDVEDISEAGSGVPNDDGFVVGDDISVESAVGVDAFARITDEIAFDKATSATNDVLITDELDLGRGVYLDEGVSVIDDVGFNRAVSMTDDVEVVDDVALDSALELLDSATVTDLVEFESAFMTEDILTLTDEIVFAIQMAVEENVGVSDEVTVVLNNALWDYARWDEDTWV